MTACTSCKVGYENSVGTTICDLCVAGKYKDANENCNDCNANCTLCTSATVCTACKTGSLSVAPSELCESCVVGKYFGAIACEPCPTNCV